MDKELFYLGQISQIDPNNGMCFTHKGLQAIVMTPRRPSVGDHLFKEDNHIFIGDFEHIQNSNECLDRIERMKKANDILDGDGAKPMSEKDKKKLQEIVVELKKFGVTLPAGITLKEAENLKSQILNLSKEVATQADQERGKLDSIKTQIEALGGSLPDGMSLEDAEALLETLKKRGE